MNTQAQLSTAQQLGSGGGAPAGLTDLESSGVAAEGEDDDDIPELEAVEEDGPLDETGVDPKDIELVMAQVNCSRAKAVRTLKESGGDLINASKSFFRMSPGHYLTVHCSHGSKRVIMFSVLSVSLSRAIHTLASD
jgi:NACalpha-BTF3-like transcription factor